MRLHLLISALAVAGFAFAQAPMLMPSRGLAEELQAQSTLGWRGIFLAGGAYQPVEERWLENQFLPHFRAVVRHLRLRGDAESFDCDNFAELFRSELAVENALAGNAALGEVACAIAVVEQQHSFGRVLAGRNLLHSLVLVRTDEGWRVVEPQSGRLASLDKYPNRKGIEAVYF